jgi:hypothetical protein
VIDNFMEAYSMKHYTFSKFAVFTLVFVILFSTVSAKGISEARYRQEEVPAVNFCISEAPIVSNFPAVNLVFRAFDQNLRPISDVPAQNIRISENGQTPVPISGNMQVNSLGLGVDFYILVDKGNRTDQGSAKSVLDTFVTYDDPTKDQVFIYTDESNRATPYFAPGNGAVIDQAVIDFPTGRIGNYRTADGAVGSILSDINAGFNKCQKPKFLFLILGDDAITSAEKIAEFTLSAKSSNTILVLFHTPTASGEVGNDSYRSLVEDNGGYYVDVSQSGASPFLSLLASYRQSFSVSYNSTNGSSGRHDLAFSYEGVPVPTQGANSYQIGLLPPQVSLVIPSTTIERTAIKTVKKGYVYDKTDDIASVQAIFPDEFHRKIESIVLIINQSGKPELRIPVKITSSAGDIYQVKWSLGDLGDGNRADLSIRTEIVDELGMTAVSSPDVPVIVLSHIPLNLLAERYYNYILLGIVVLLLFIMLIMRRKMSQLMSGVGAGVKAVVEGVRKTLVGGGKRGKPLATIKIMDGPPTMIGQELKIYTEVVKLGRDPQRADMTFYTPDVNSSISGLHARIERVNGAWRIVAVSQSGSETFVDDYAIPFNEPQSLQSGQTVRLGYLAQQPIVFTFDILGVIDPVGKTDIGNVQDYRKTDVSNNTMPVGLKMSGKKREEIKPQQQGQDDDIFNEFRDR